jgi:hypothetical protein
MKKSICPVLILSSLVLFSCGEAPDAEVLLAELAETPDAIELALVASDATVAHESEKPREEPRRLFLRCDVNGDGKITGADIELFSKFREHPRELACPAVLDGDNNLKLNRDDKQACIKVWHYFRETETYPFPWRESRFIKKTQCKRVL